LVKARRATAGVLLTAKTNTDAASEIQARLRELIKLAKEQGYLTFDDLNEALPEGITDANELDAILTRLRRMEIDVIEASDVDRHKEVKKDFGRGRGGETRDQARYPR
jgi:RNA polymerase primary sigma factor